MFRKSRRLIGWAAHAQLFCTQVLTNQSSINPNLYNQVHYGQAPPMFASMFVTRFLLWFTKGLLGFLMDTVSIITWSIHGNRNNLFLKALLCCFLCLIWHDMYLSALGKNDNLMGASRPNLIALDISSRKNAQFHETTS